MIARRSRSVLVSLCLCLGVAWMGGVSEVIDAQPAARPVALSPDVVAKIDAAVAAERDRQHVPGLGVALAVRRELVYAKGFGSADLEHDIPATAETVFRTGSIAKPMTAVAVMQIAESGKLDLDAPIQKSCAAFPEKPQPVTARQLLGHLGGVRHYARRGEASGKAHFFTLADSLVLFKDEPLRHEPGSTFLYTTYGYSVLGCAMEGATGRTYEDYMRSDVFRPAGMSATRVDRVWDVIPHRARGYQRLTQSTFDALPPQARAALKPGEIYNADLHDTSMKVPGGGLVSTAPDLVRFSIALMNGVLLKPAVNERMWTEGQTKDGKSTGYGLGWGVAQQDGVRVISHSGGQAGASCLLLFMPDAGISVAVMTNLEGARLEGLTRDLAAILRDASPTSTSATPRR